MKKLSIITLGILISMNAFAQHDHGNSGHANQANKMKDSETMGFKVPVEFTNQLNGVFKASLNMTESFASDNSEDAQKQAGNVISVLAKVNMELLTDSEAMMDWMMNLKDMNTALNTISASSDIKVQRASFDAFNQAMFKSLKSYGAAGDKVYYQHCPMANDKKGAHWLSTSKDISNPYFGGMMKSCGSTKETLQ